jgi:ATP-dependent DNA ligase
MIPGLFQPPWPIRIASGRLRTICAKCAGRTGSHASPHPPQQPLNIWVRPELVVEVTFLTWTADGLLREVVYAGLRKDKDARDVRRE